MLHGTRISENAPYNIILSYQEEIDLWLSRNDILLGNQLLSHNGIVLYKNPSILQKYPEDKVFGRGGGNIGIFAFGKFLSKFEAEQLYQTAYMSIPQDIKQRFMPFRSLEYFRNSIIFNPNGLLGNIGGLNSDSTEDFAYLIFYFGSYYEWYIDNVFNIQSGQINNGISKEYLIFPYSFHYALFRINNNGNIELVNFYGVN